MIIGRNRREVIGRIHENASKKAFHTPTEINDPDLGTNQSRHLISQFWNHKSKKSWQLLSAFIRGLFYLVTPPLTYDLEIKGNKNLADCQRAFITCNHYNQLDVLPIKRLAMQKHRRLYFFVKDSNLIMHFPIGLIVRNADTVPVNQDWHYLGRDLPQHLKQIFKRPCWLLVYPEQEMWFNYRKPRPLKKGAYYYAAKMNLPIISCFVEIQNRKSHEWFHRDFYQTKRILHILPPIYPDPNESVAKNMRIMRKQDFLQKKHAYEKAYGKKLDYAIANDDIAGIE